MKGIMLLCRTSQNCFWLFPEIILKRLQGPLSTSLCCICWRMSTNKELIWVFSKGSHDKSLLNVIFRSASQYFNCWSILAGMTWTEKWYSLTEIVWLSLGEILFFSCVSIPSSEGFWVLHSLCRVQSLNPLACLLPVL